MQLKHAYDAHTLRLLLSEYERGDISDFTFVACINHSQFSHSSSTFQLTSGLIHEDISPLDRSVFVFGQLRFSSLVASGYCFNIGSAPDRYFLEIPHGYSILDPEVAFAVSVNNVLIDYCKRVLNL